MNSSSTPTTASDRQTDVVNYYSTGIFDIFLVYSTELWMFHRATTSKIAQDCEASVGHFVVILLVFSDSVLLLYRVI